MENLEAITAKLKERETPYVEVTVVRRIRPSSANVGDRAVVTADGEMYGFVGGQCTKSLVVEQAQACLHTGESRLLLVTAHPPGDPGEGVTVLPMTCHSEGTVELFMEPRLQTPVLAVIGDSPIAVALLRQGPQLGFRVVQSTLVSNQSESKDVRVASTDTATGTATATALGRKEVVLGERTVMDPVVSLRAAWDRQGMQPSYGLVATMGMYDVDGVLALAHLPLLYLGVVTSPRRWRILREELASAGVPKPLLDTASAPAGLDIGAVGPEEIALSILAELVQTRRRNRAALHTTDGETNEAGATNARTVDPVCGMTVDLTRTEHTAMENGVIYGFCCAGCKNKFLSNPSQYTLREEATDADV